eukprot:SAG11_NODE_20011_length_454_cov_1.419718_1_plen_64_part_00
MPQYLNYPSRYYLLVARYMPGYGKVDLHVLKFTYTGTEYQGKGKYCTEVQLRTYNELNLLLLL